MIDQLAELNRILLIVKSLGGDTQAINRNTVIQECQSIAIEGKMPDHSQSIDFTIQIELLILKRKRNVILNNNGENFLNLNPDKYFDLTDKQKKYLLRTCFFDGVFQRDTKKCLNCFEKSDVKGTFTWSETDGKPFGAFNWIVPYLEQLGLVWRRSENLTVRKEYASTVAEFISEPKGWTEEQHFEYMKEKKELGNLAENIVREWEVERLKKSGHQVEAHCVKKIRWNAIRPIY